MNTAQPSLDEIIKEYVRLEVERQLQLRDLPTMIETRQETPSQMSAPVFEAPETSYTDLSTSAPTVTDESIMSNPTDTLSPAKSILERLRQKRGNAQ